MCIKKQTFPAFWEEEEELLTIRKACVFGLLPDRNLRDDADDMIWMGALRLPNRNGKQKGLPNRIKSIKSEHLGLVGVDLVASSHGETVLSGRVRSGSGDEIASKPKKALSFSHNTGSSLSRHQLRFFPLPSFASSCHRYR
ncbi:hypothetical protein BHE74_00050901 [Ensete ventricosum]|nr:hypothetical protein GW17_00029955 [Ensete ventricosum]RWW43439.1 hypothetical protein BHE74_00050901 [Ensete ventricosum]